MSPAKLFSSSAGPSESSPMVLEAGLVQLAQRVGEVAHLDQVDMLQRAGGGFRQHARFLRAVARGGDQRAGAEGDGRAHDRADIVRVGDLVEHDDQSCVAERVERLGLQRLGLDQRRPDARRPCR